MPQRRAIAAVAWPRTRGTNRLLRLRGPPPRRSLLADVCEQFGVPAGRDVEGLVARDAREGDRLERVAVLFVVTDHAGLAAQGGINGKVRHRLDEGKVLGVGLRRAR